MQKCGLLRVFDLRFIIVDEDEKVIPLFVRFYRPILFYGTQGRNNHFCKNISILLYK